jgi:hypothetical protein
VKDYLGKFHPSVLAGAFWATFAALVVHWRLEKVGLKASVPRPPRLSGRAGRGVAGALRRLEPTCLEKALVQQAWLASHGVMKEVVIGVPPDGMHKDPAHAWVDGLDPLSPNRYLELHRLPPPSFSHDLTPSKGRPLALDNLGAKDQTRGDTTGLSPAVPPAASNPDR